MSCTCAKGRSVVVKLERHRRIATRLETRVTTHQHSPDRALRPALLRRSYAVRSLLLLIAATGCSDAITSSAKQGPVVATLVLSRGEVPSLHLGQVVTLQASARDDNGALVRTAPLTWSTGDAAVVRVKPTASSRSNAMVTAAGAGATTVTVSSGSITASVTLLVHAPGPVARVFLVGHQQLSVGSAVQVWVVQSDSQGVPLTAPVPVLSSSDSTIARVSESGRAVGFAPGTATLTATSNGVSGAMRVTVMPSEHAFLWTDANGMTDLGTISGFASSRAVAVSSAGHVAGSVFTVADSVSHAFVRAPGASAVMRDLGGLAGGGSSGALGVNAAGQVVGYATTSTGKSRAVLWRSTGEVVDLGTANGDQESAALGINDAGQVVGWTRGEQFRPFIWTEATGMRIIAGIDRGRAFAINRSGIVVGERDERPFAWNATASPVVLPPLSGDTWGRALAISDAGEIVGISTGCSPSDYPYFDDECYPPTDRPVMWLNPSSPADLLRNAGSSSAITSAVGINSARQVVGSNASQRAFLWSPADGLRNLGVLPGRASSIAYAINDAGVVVGSSFNP